MTRLKQLTILFTVLLFTANSFATAMIMENSSLNTDTIPMSVMEDGKGMGECENCHSQPESCGHCGANCVFNLAVGTNERMSSASHRDIPFVRSSSTTFQSISGLPEPFPPRKMNLT